MFESNTDYTMFKSNTEKKIITAVMITAVFLFSIYLFLTNLKLAIVFLIFMSICFLAFMVLNTLADKDLKIDDAQQDKDLKVDDTPQDMEVPAEGKEKTQAELKVVDTSNNEGQNVGISAEEQAKIQAALEEELRDEQAKKYMKPNSELKDGEKFSNNSINVFGAPISSKAQDTHSIDSTQPMVVPDKISLGSEAQNIEGKHSVDYTKAMVVPDKISLDSEAQNTEGKHSVDYTKAMVVPYTITLGTHGKTQNEQLDLAGEMTSLPTHMNVIGGTIVPQNNVVSNTIPPNQSLSLLKIDTTTKSTYTGADIAATMRVPSTISFHGMDQQHQPYVQNYMSLMQSPPAHMSAFYGSVPSSQEGIRI